MIPKDIVESIRKMQANGSRLELPTGERLANYPEVKRTLVKAGGKYSKCGFTFTSDAATIQARLVGGEKIDDKKKFQFFETPETLARELVCLAAVSAGMDVLEPSAGQGAIVRQFPDGVREALVEIMPENAAILRQRGWNVIEGDFLQVSPKCIGTFDRVVANPPFAKNQDIDHIRHMFTFLKDGGRVVSIASNSWRIGSQKKQKAFREWLDELDATVLDLPRGTFAESGTQVAACIVIIDRPQ